MRSERFGSASRLLALCIALAAPPALAGESPVEIRLVAGFGGVGILSSRCLPIVIEVSNHGAESVRGDLRIATEVFDRSLIPPMTIAKDVVISPSSTIRRRILARPVFPLRIEFVADQAGAARIIDEGSYTWYTGGALSIDSRTRVFDLPGAGKALPFPVAACVPAYLPEDPSAYERVYFAALCDADPNEWDPPQVRAFESYLRSGGTLIISGGARASAVLASPVIARWIADAPEARAVLTDQGTPILREIPFGLGRILISTIDIYSPSSDERLRSAVTETLLGEGWEASADPGQRIPPRPHWPAIMKAMGDLVDSRQGDIAEVRVPVAFFLLYVVAIAVAGAVAARRRRLSGVCVIAAIVILFAAGAAGVFQLMEAPPSPAARASVCRYGPRGTGAEIVFCRIESAGRTGHRLTVWASNVDTYAIARECRMPFPVLFHAHVRDARKVTREIDVPRWGARGLLAVADAEGPPPLRIRAVWRKPKPVPSPTSGTAGGPAGPTLVPAGSVSLRIERNPEYTGPMPIDLTPPSRFPDVTRRVLVFLGISSLGRARGACAVISVERLTTSVYLGASGIISPAPIVDLDPVLRGEAATVEFELSRRIEQQPAPEQTFAALQVILDYVVPPETGPKVEGEGVAFEPPIRLIQQCVRVEEEP